MREKDSLHLFVAALTLAFLSLTVDVQVCIFNLLRMYSEFLVFFFSLSLQTFVVNIFYMIVYNN